MIQSMANIGVYFLLQKTLYELNEL